MAFKLGDIVNHFVYGKGLVIDSHRTEKEDVLIVEVCFIGRSNKKYVAQTGEPVTEPNGSYIVHYKPDLYLSDKVISLVDNYAAVVEKLERIHAEVNAICNLHNAIEAQWQERFDSQEEELNWCRELIKAGEVENFDPVGFAKDVSALNELLQKDDGLRTTLSGEPIVIQDELKLHPPVTE